MAEDIKTNVHASDQGDGVKARPNSLAGPVIMPEASAYPQRKDECGALSPLGKGWSSSSQDALSESEGPDPGSRTQMSAAQNTGIAEPSLSAEPGSTHTVGTSSEDNSPTGPFRSTTNSDCSLMPPPTAPASLLWSLKPSKKAKKVNSEVNGLQTDPSIYRRLIAAVVILFRMGKALEAKKLGQYTLDLVGKRAWDEELPTYLGAQQEPGDADAVVPLLEQTVLMIRYYDPASSGYLQGMLSMMD